MSDLISRQAAIDLFPNDALEWDTIYGYIAPHLARRMIEELPPEEPHWTPCSEGLPKKIGSYLVTLEYKEHGKGVTTLWYHGEQIGWDLRVADVVIAWMPLPAAYEKEKN